MRRFNRKFGIELEFGCEWSRLKRVASEIIKKVYGPRKYYAKEESFESDFKTDKWHIKIDFSSISELTTPISTIRDLDKIQQVVSYLRDKSVEPTEDCGFHVHFDISDIDQYHLMAGWMRSERAIFECTPSVRKDNYHCEKVLESKCMRSYIANFLKTKTDGAGSSSAISFEHYEERKTVEIRLGEGTNDPEFVRNWVLFFLHWIDSVKQQNPSLITCDKCNSLKYWELMDEMNITTKWVKEYMDIRHEKYKNVR